MSESTVDKTKRKLTDLLRTHEWNYQYSIFFYGQSEELLQDLPAFKKRITRLFSEAAMLVCLRMIKPKVFELQAYVTIFTNKKLDFATLEDTADKFFVRTTKVNSRSITPYKLFKTIKSIKKQKPHDLKSYFKQSKVNRYSLLNKDLVTLNTTPIPDQYDWGDDDLL